MSAIKCISGIVTRIIIFALHNGILYLYQLTDLQYLLFKKCLVVYSIEAVTHFILEFLYIYLLYLNNMKMVYGTNAFYYALLILTDWVVVRNDWDLSALLCCTAVCNVAYSILTFTISDFRKTKSSYSMTRALDLAKHGFDIMFDRVTGKVATLFFQCFASKLGTETFAIHGVCYAVSVLMESYTNGLYTFTVNRLNKVRRVAGKYKSHLWIIKHYGSLVLLLVAVSIIQSLFLLHGSVSVASCIPFYLLFVCILFP